MTFRRLAITFALVLNTATLILTVLTLGNASELGEVASGETGEPGSLLVIARGDASLLTTLALLSLAANLALAYAIFRRGPALPARREADRPRISGE